jgi:hypothetical protein
MERLSYLHKSFDVTGRLACLLLPGCCDIIGPRTFDIGKAPITKFSTKGGSASGGQINPVLFHFVWVKEVYKIIERRYYPVIKHRRWLDGRTNPFYPSIGAYEALERC